MSFALVIGILLLNILIAEIGSEYTDMREQGRLAFWSQRLNFITEISFSTSALSCLDQEMSIKRPNKKEMHSLLKQGRIDFATISTWIYKDLETHDSPEGAVSSDEKEFFIWYLKAKDMDRQPFFKRMRVFLSRASMREIIFPGKSFERVVSKNTYKSRSFLFIFYPIIPIFVIILFALGLFSFGVLWPRSLKEHLFNGPVGETVDKVDLEAKIKKMEGKLDQVLQLLRDKAASA